MLKMTKNTVLGALAALTLSAGMSTQANAASVATPVATQLAFSTGFHGGGFGGDVPPQRNQIAANTHRNRSPNLVHNGYITLYPLDQCTGRVLLVITAIKRHQMRQ